MSATAASRATGGYVPPFATATAAAGGGGGGSTSGGTGITFASIASRTAGTGTATTSIQIVDSTGGVDSSSLLEYFTKVRSILSIKGYFHCFLSC